MHYEDGAKEQLDRLSKYVKCVKWTKGEIVECDKYFANFNLDQANYVKANEYYFVVHANFNEIGYKPNISTIEHLNPKFLGVSKFACREFTKFTGKPCELCYNPMTFTKEEDDKVIRLVSACRLNDKVKGGARTKELIKALDSYALMNNRHYMWYIFTNDVAPINSPNVCIMKPRVDVRPFIRDCEVGLQLSNDMETWCYSISEFAHNSMKIVSTPLSVLPEHNLPKGAVKILDWNCENINEVVEWIFNAPRKKYKYNPPIDNYANLLAKGHSTYREELKMKYKVKANKMFENIIDNEVGRARKEGETWEVDKARLEKLQSIKGLINVVEEEKPIEEATKPIKEVKKAVKKSTKNAK